MRFRICIKIEEIQTLTLVLIQYFGCCPINRKYMLSVNMKVAMLVCAVLHSNPRDA